MKSDSTVLFCSDLRVVPIGTTNLAAYSATKFAVRGLTQTVGEQREKTLATIQSPITCAALELAPHKITVNAYAPGFIITDLGM